MKTDQTSDNIMLAMDTSTADLTVAVLQNDQCLKEIRVKAERSHSTQLIPCIQKLLSDVDLKMKDLDCIAAGHGPGSYTGVRIAVTVAKTLAWALDIPLFGVSSLEGLSYGLYRDMKQSEMGENEAFPWIIPILNARRGQVYTGVYEFKEHGRSNRLPDGIRLMEKWIEQIHDQLQSQSSSKQITFVGDVDDFKSEISTLEEISGQKVNCFEKHMNAYDIGLLALSQWDQSKINEPHHFIPNYTQLTEAERNL
ncbi:tRNA (adenosine(37)-N6)-threonylcarbamoyltransferase complex dimerization subunit type 1 TsaB [Chengkuizengella sediminis]|uniref:tRNA (adenosine(37)-N6)-threonylcarbamoyltransferase complex dimerization subunit type 1 TsaB n=1 Tax=Chengkuizengella sediminis TaxID=1885917 RepID=UPI0013894A30|nr:tRNA (adenosine(37)-N6)-threonylcarbamoyltransferase complex dimerization subunit type 1 TsaB [Chengkuizengella sediminis]NDI34713.1 tRNA (adenosine(37)-N6)-threonylcarbamoyltransferase complex dimerization subunit type 1 TsaB [Chengkuizengella sediminis]